MDRYSIIISDGFLMKSAVVTFFPNFQGTGVAGPACSVAAMLFAVAIGALSAAAPVHAAGQGELAGASRGLVSISASVAGRARLSGLAESGLLLAGPRGAAGAEAQVCLISNSASGLYDLVATGNGVGGAFALVDPGGASNPLTLTWAEVASSPVALAPGVALHGLAASRTPCPADAASTLAVSAAAPGAGAAGVLTLTFAPR